MKMHNIWCMYCGGWIGAHPTNMDHVPSKSLLKKPYPPHLPTISACRECNEGFSLDEEYLTTFLACVLAGSTNPNDHTNARVGRALRRNPKLMAKIEKSKLIDDSLWGKTKLLWEPEWERVQRVLIKNARGHAFYEHGEPMLDAPYGFGVKPLVTMPPEKRASFEIIDYGSNWPEVGSRMMTRLITGEDLVDNWVMVQEGVYRYAAIYSGGMAVRMVLYEYLAAEVIWNDYKKKLVIGVNEIALGL